MGGSTEQGGPGAGGFRVLAIGVSAGGLQALTRLFEELPADFPMAVLVVQHLSPGYDSRAADILQRRSALTIRQAQGGEPVEPGVVYLAPPDRHLTVTAQGRTALDRGARVHFTRPSVDVLFRSVASVFGPRVVGLVLTGGGEDGAEGAEAVSDTGGLVLVQEPEDALNAGMPRAVLRRLPAVRRIELSDLAPSLLGLTSPEWPRGV